MEEKGEVLFKGPLNMTKDAVKCNYIIYWSRDTGMELVGKWEIEENPWWKQEYNQQVFWSIWRTYSSQIKHSDSSCGT